MTVRRTIFLPLACAGLLLGAGCGPREGAAFAPETDDPTYQQGVQLQRQGRQPEALTAYLKVIDLRGDRNAPESHLQAGIICLQQTHDPIEAIHHFNRYLQLLPRSPEAAMVRGLVESARREYARTLPARPLDDQSTWLALRDQVDQLQRENAELRAKYDALRGSAGTPILRFSSTTPDAAGSKPLTPVDAPIVAVPPPVAPAPSPLFSLNPAPAPSNTKPGATASAAKPAAGRTHTVAPRDTLYSISVKYYHTGAKVDAIFNANRAIMRDKNTLPPVGTEINLP